MKIKTNELIGPALDWAVAKCEGKDSDCEVHAGNVLYGRVTSGFVQYLPSADWSQGGPIIEREGINLGTQRNEPGFRPSPERMWHAQVDTRTYVGYGPTPLIAAMRCYVASKLGDTVDIPDTLT